MSNKSTTKDLKGQEVYIGLDVHLNSWVGSFFSSEGLMRQHEFIKPRVEQVMNYLHQKYAGAKYHVAYEAGFCGFWIARELQRQGVEVTVAHAADIPSSDKQKRRKNDQRDSYRIGDSLRKGQLEKVYVLSDEQEMERCFARERWRISKEERRIKNQIKSHLNFRGITAPENINMRYWSKRMVDWLEQEAEQRKDLALRLKLNTYQVIRQMQLKAIKELRSYFKDKHQDLFTVLRSVPGIGVLTAILLITELINMQRFETTDQLLNYVGLVPDTYCSGEQKRVGEMTRRGNRRIRSALIESAWMAKKKDSYLQNKFDHLCTRMSKQKVIVKIARILLRRIRHVWRHNEKYQLNTGKITEGTKPIELGKLEAIPVGS